MINKIIKLYKKYEISSNNKYLRVCVCWVEEARLFNILVHFYYSKQILNVFSPVYSSKKIIFGL